MPTVQARIPTERASRYLVQLCRHVAAIGDRANDAGHMRFIRSHGRHLGGPGGQHDGGQHDDGQHEDGQRVEIDAQWSDAAGVIRFAPYGRCELEAGESDLVIRIEAEGEAQLERIQKIVTERLGGFGRRERLDIQWHRTGGEAEGQPPPR